MEGEYILDEVEGKAAESRPVRKETLFGGGGGGGGSGGGVILNPYQEDVLIFDNSTQKIALALQSTELTNNTSINITKDKWFLYGTFTERDDPYRVRFQIVKMVDKTLASIIGSATSSDAKSIAKVELETTFASFDITGFAISRNLWEILRIVPLNYVTNLNTNTQEYTVTVFYNRVEFTLLQLAANMGGFISILSAVYFVLFGSQRVNPWGIVQRYILKNVPAPPTVYTSSYNNLEKGYLSPDHQFVNDYFTSIPQDVLPIQYSMTDTLLTEDSQIRRLRHDLKAEVQMTIAHERYERIEIIFK
ncbi:hypothetical protein C1645_836006 [Glomus cerebriforme]|uniref:Uncharacterized protein n=1 Tax=Glomus cerebriforme TaxID=658196 RepID=A0A397S7T6_9GLOM|nr:hypothetical protein C1645_836006 [Glomus cerebriforme]